MLSGSASFPLRRRAACGNQALLVRTVGNYSPELSRGEETFLFNRESDERRPLADVHCVVHFAQRFLQHGLDVRVQTEELELEFVCRVPVVVEASTQALRCVAVKLHLVDSVLAERELGEAREVVHYVVQEGHSARQR